MRILKYILAISVALGFLVYVCLDIFFPNGFGSGTEEQGKQEKNTALTLGIPNTISSLPFWVAEEDSLFDSLRVDITIRQFTDQLDIDKAFADGKINLAVTDQERAKSQKGFNEVLRLPYPYAMVANRKSRLANITQLKDKMLAVTRNSVYSVAAKHCLDSLKMKQDSVYIVQINNPNIALLMLQNNELDAIFLPEPYITLAKKMGHNTLYTSATEALLIANDKNNADEMQKFRKAYDEAVKRIRKNGVQHYAELIAQRCKCQRSDSLTVVFGEGEKYNDGMKK